MAPHQLFPYDEWGGRRTPLNLLGETPGPHEVREELSVIKSDVATAVGPNACATFTREEEDGEQLCFSDLGDALDDDDDEDVGVGSSWQRRDLTARRGVEIFVGGLTRSTRRDMLRDWFQHAGEVTEVRIARDKRRRRCRGYGYVRFATSEQANRAIETMHRFEFKPGRFLGVLPSDENRTLFVGGLREEWSCEEFCRLLGDKMPGLKKVEPIPDREDRFKMRTFCFLEFATHDEAAVVFNRHQVETPPSRAPQTFAGSGGDTDTTSNAESSATSFERESRESTGGSCQENGGGVGPLQGKLLRCAVRDSYRSTLAASNYLYGDSSVLDFEAGGANSGANDSGNGSTETMDGWGRSTEDPDPGGGGGGAFSNDSKSRGFSSMPHSQHLRGNSCGAAVEALSGWGTSGAVVPSRSGGGGATGVQLVVGGAILKVDWADPLRYHIHLNGGIKGPCAPPELALLPDSRQSSRGPRMGTGIRGGARCGGNDGVGIGMASDWYAQPQGLMHRPSDPQVLPKQRHDGDGHPRVIRHDGSGSQHQQSQQQQQYYQRQESSSPCSGGGGDARLSQPVQRSMYGTPAAAALLMRGPRRTASDPRCGFPSSPRRATYDDRGVIDVSGSMSTSSRRNEDVVLGGGGGGRARTGSYGGSSTHHTAYPPLHRQTSGGSLDYVGSGGQTSSPGGRVPSEVGVQPVEPRFQRHPRHSDRPSSAGEQPSSLSDYRSRWHHYNTSMHREPHEVNQPLSSNVGGGPGGRFNIHRGEGNTGRGGGGGRAYGASATGISSLGAGHEQRGLTRSWSVTPPRREEQLLRMLSWDGGAGTHDSRDGEGGHDCSWPCRAGRREDGMMSANNMHHQSSSTRMWLDRDVAGVEAVLPPEASMTSSAAIERSRRQRREAMAAFAAYRPSRKQSPVGREGADSTQQQRSRDQQAGGWAMEAAAPHGRRLSESAVMLPKERSHSPETWPLQDNGVGFPVFDHGFEPNGSDPPVRRSSTTPLARRYSIASPSASSSASSRPLITSGGLQDDGPSQEQLQQPRPNVPPGLSMKQGTLARSIPAAVGSGTGGGGRMSSTPAVGSLGAVVDGDHRRWLHRSGHSWQAGGREGDKDSRVGSATSPDPESSEVVGGRSWGQLHIDGRGRGGRAGRQEFDSENVRVGSGLWDAIGSGGGASSWPSSLLSPENGVDKATWGS